MKNLTELEGNWKELKGKLKQKYAMLTDSDLLLIEGKKDELVGRLVQLPDVLFEENPGDVLIKSLHVVRGPFPRF